MPVSAGLDQAAEGVHVFAQGRGGPVNEVEVDVVEAESLQAGGAALLGSSETVVGGGQLGGDEQLRARNAGSRDRTADRGFVAVGGRGVDESAADFQRGRHRAFGFVLR